MKKYKLNFENLRLHNILDGDGNFSRTPEASELDELEVRYRLADWLYQASTEGTLAIRNILGTVIIWILSRWLVIIFVIGVLTGESDLRGYCLCL